MSAKGVYRSFLIGRIDTPEYLRLSAPARSVLFHIGFGVGPWGIVVWYLGEMLARLVCQTGYSTEVVEASRVELEAAGWIRSDGNVLWVTDHLRDDPHLSSANPKHRKALHRHLAGLPKLEVVKAFAARYSEWIPIQEATAMDIQWLSNGYRKATAIKEEEQEKDSKKDSEEDAASATSVCRALLLETDQPAFDKIISQVPAPEMWDSEIKRALDDGISPHLVGKGIREFVADGKLATHKLTQLVRYIQGATDEPKSPTAVIASATAIYRAMKSSGFCHSQFAKDDRERTLAESMAGLSPESQADLRTALPRLNFNFLVNVRTENEAVKHISECITGLLPTTLSLSRSNGNKRPAPNGAVAW